jgi:propionyl-CoA carboxylase beta chain
VLDAPPIELVAGWCSRLRLYLGRRKGAPIGIFINPPGRSNNLITVRTLDKYAAGLDLFRALGVPIVSFLDSPGFDPRIEQSEANNFRRMLAVGNLIIRYPHGAMGVVTHRCFGGAATLLFPKVFGGQRVVALRGCRVGVMQDSIVDRLLGGCPRLHEQWRKAAASQTPDLADLLDHGSIDAVIDLPQLGDEIDRFLRLVSPPRLVRRSPRHRGTRPRPIQVRA